MSLMGLNLEVDAHLRDVPARADWSAGKQYQPSGDWGAVGEADQPVGDSSFTIAPQCVQLADHYQQGEHSRAEAHATVRVKLQVRRLHGEQEVGGGEHDGQDRDRRGMPVQRWRLAAESGEAPGRRDNLQAEVMVAHRNDGPAATRLAMPAANPYVIAVGGADPHGTEEPRRPRCRRVQQPWQQRPQARSGGPRENCGVATQSRLVP